MTTFRQHIAESQSVKEREIMQNAKTEFPYAYAALGHFIDKQYDEGKIDDVRKEVYTRTPDRRDIEYKLNVLMFEYEYSYLENIEDIDWQVKEIIGEDNPNF